MKTDERANEVLRLYNVGDFVITMLLLAHAFIKFATYKKNTQRAHLKARGEARRDESCILRALNYCLQRLDAIPRL